MKNISCKKIVALITIIMIGGYLAHHFRSYITFIQKDSLLSHIDPRIFRMGDEVTWGMYLDVAALQRSLLRDYGQQIKHYWKKATIKFVPVSEFQAVLDEEDSGASTIPKMTFYFRKEYCPTLKKNFLIFEKFSVNYAFLWATMYHAYPKPGDTTNAGFIEEARTAIAESEKLFQEDYLGRIETIGAEIRKGYPNCRYTETEIKALFAFSFPCIFMNQFILSGVDNLPLNERQEHWEALGYRDMMSHNSWLYVYVEYFYSEGWWYFFFQTIKYRLWLAGMYLMIVVCFLNLIRRDAALVVREELYKLGITMNRRMIWRIVLSNWRFFVLPTRDAKMRPIIAAACEAVYQRQQDRMLRTQANLIWKRCYDLQNRPSLEGDYRIVSGASRKADLDKRQKALVRLLAGEQHLRQRQAQPAQVAKSTAEDHLAKAKRSEPAQSNREKALDLVRELLPERAAVALETLSVEKLERLALVITMIKKWHPQAVKKLLERNSLSVVLTKSRLLDATLAGDRTIVLEELGLAEKKVTRSKDIIIAKYATMLRGTSVLIIGGGRTEGKRRELLEAIADLGATDCRILSTDDRGKIRDAIEAGQELVVFIATDNSHGTRALLDAERVPYLTVNRLNRDRFLRELIVQYQKTQSV